MAVKPPSRGRRLLIRVAVSALLLGAAGALSLALFLGYGRVAAQDRQRADRLTAAPPGGRYVAAADSRLFVQQLGRTEAPAVVFIHGTGSWSETWRASMQAAAGLGYRAVAIDLPPFGYSVPPASGDYSKASQARRLLAALDSLGIARATFVAHSFGAAPVVEALMADPGRARALVLVDAALGLSGPATDGRDSVPQQLLRLPWISQPVSAVFLTNPAYSGTLLRAFISEKDRATPDWIALYQRPLALAGSYQQVALWLPELLARRGAARSDDPDAYRHLPFHVSLIWGETDGITPLSQATQLHGLLTGASLSVIPRAGHIPQIEEPALFRRALLDALGPAAD